MNITIHVPLNVKFVMCDLPSAFDDDIFQHQMLLFVNSLPLHCYYC